MTEGIIQKIFDNYMINHNVKPSFLNGLKQELIEEIKKEMPFLNDGVMKMIIGDNE